MSDSMYRWSVLIKFKDAARKDVEKKAYDVGIDEAKTFLKLVKADRLDREGKPHVTYDHYALDSIDRFVLTELDRPVIVKPTAIIKPN